MNMTIEEIIRKHESDKKETTQEVRVLSAEQMLTKRLDTFLSYLPDYRRGLFVQILALLPEDRREVFIRFAEDNHLVNDKRAMLWVLGELSRFNQVADAVEASKAGSKVLEQELVAVLESSADVIVERVFRAAGEAVERLEVVADTFSSAADRLNQALERSEQYAQKQIAWGDGELSKLAKLYKEREAKANEAHTARMKEIDGFHEAVKSERARIAEETTLVYSKRAVKEISAAVVPKVMKALTVWAYAGMFATVLAAMVVGAILLKKLGL